MPTDKTTELTVEDYFAALEEADTTFHIKWSYLSKRYMLTIPWLGLEFEGKTLLEALRAWKESQQ